jgi:ferredoxin
MGRPVWFVELIKRVFPSRFAVARLTNWPVVGGLLQRLLAGGDDLIYLPRSDVVQVDQALDLPDSLVLPSRIVDHFIEQARHHWIMNACICRDAEKCEDYPRDLGCLFLGEAVRSINPKLGRLVTKEEALAHTQRCREAGLVHLVGRNRLDTLWLGAGPGDKLLTICNCCPCCCLWRILPEVSSGIGDRVHRMPGVMVEVTDRCVGCGVCAQGVCFVDALQVVDGRAVRSDLCRGCGRCVAVCPEGAIRLSLPAEDVIEQVIKRIGAAVDVRG